MVRVVRPGGTASRYAWNVLGGGPPSEPVSSAMRAMGLKTPIPHGPGGAAAGSG
jgi:hypothetical protein